MSNYHELRSVISSGVIEVNKNDKNLSVYVELAFY